MLFIMCTPQYMHGPSDITIVRSINVQYILYIGMLLIKWLSKSTDEQYTTIIQSTAEHFDLRVFVNCLQMAYKMAFPMLIY